jgi:hypothetical protein
MAYIPSAKESVVTHSASTRPGIPTTGSWRINAAASLTHYYYFYIYDEVLGPMVMRVASFDWIHSSSSRSSSPSFR